MVNLYYFDTGLTLIANENESGELEYPMVFQHQIDPNGRISLMFNPWFLFSKKPTMAPVNLNSLLFKLEADEKMKEKYNGLVTQAKASESGLVIPGGPNIAMKKK